MTITQYNSSNSINELRWKKEMIWMNSLTYRPRLKKDLWSKFRFGPKIRTTRPAESEIRPKIHYWSTIHCVSKSANPLDLPQKSTIQALFKAKAVDPETYSPPLLNEDKYNLTNNGSNRHFTRGHILLRNFKTSLFSRITCTRFCSVTMNCCCKVEE